MDDEASEQGSEEHQLELLSSRVGRGGHHSRVRRRGEGGAPGHDVCVSPSTQDSSLICNTDNGDLAEDLQTDFTHPFEF